MHIFSCESTLEAILTCIYEAWTSRLGFENIMLMPEPIRQYSLFDEYHHVEADEVKAGKVMDAVINKISPEVYEKIAYCAMSYEEDAMNVLYHVMILGFSKGADVFNMVMYKDVMRWQEINKHLSGEICHFREFIRFHEIAGNVYIAHIEPRSRLVVALGPCFEDRMPSEDFIIVDDVHKEAVVHVKDEPFYLKKLNVAEYQRLLMSEQNNDEYTDLWKVFFDSIAIKERSNRKCQTGLFPIWTRKHVVEFMS